jgi:hypothetical protein
MFACKLFYTKSLMPFNYYFLFNPIIIQWFAGNNNIKGGGRGYFGWRGGCLSEEHLCLCNMFSLLHPWNNIEGEICSTLEKPAPVFLLFSSKTIYEWIPPFVKILKK